MAKIQAKHKREKVVCALCEQVVTATWRGWPRHHKVRGKACNGHNYKAAKKEIR